MYASRSTYTWPGRAGGRRAVARLALGLMRVVAMLQASIVALAGASACADVTAPAYR